MRATISILFFLATSTTASAVELPVANLSPVVLSESQSSILFIPPAMKADCSVEGRVTVRIVRKPKNGTIEPTDRMGHTNFVKDNHAASLYNGFLILNTAHERGEAIYGIRSGASGRVST